MKHSVGLISVAPSGSLPDDGTRPYPAYGDSYLMKHSVDLISVAPSGSFPDGGTRPYPAYGDLPDEALRRPDKRSAIRQFAG
ncbi:hypothetical protein [Citrobacter amalonaticus]|nr:hypothetical protein [Citrobacter amalonaticus]